MATDDYRHEAACRNLDPERWFPISAHAATLDPGALDLCWSVCPVRTECLKDAVNSNHRFGTWGGYTEWERGNRSGRPQAAVDPAETPQGSETPQPVGS